MNAPFDLPLVLRALVFAAERHRGQTRKDIAKTPYIRHPVDVAPRGLPVRAKLVKLADKICNLRDIATSPPHDWSVERKREYFDWAKKVVDVMRGTDIKLEAAFDAAYAKKP